MRVTHARNTLRSLALFLIIPDSLLSNAYRMEFKDYYKILGVSKTASLDDIKTHYRRLARKYHPDVSKESNAEEKFKAMKEAYEVLKDPEKRKAYDQMGSGYRSGDQFKPPPGFKFHEQTQSRGPHVQADFSDFFESLFGQHASGRQHQPFQQHGHDQHSKIAITLEEAFLGSQRRIGLSTPDGQTRELNIKIPAGITQGQQIRLSGQGMPGFNGGQPGDLYLEITIQTHPLFTIDKKDIYLTLPVTPWEAALGEKIEVPTLGGPITFQLPPHAQTGQKIRLKGRGLPGKLAGDQYVTLSIHIPEPKNPAQKTLYEKMKSEMNFNPRKSLRA